MAGRIPEPLRMLGSAAAFVAGGIFTLSLVSSVAIHSLQSIADAKRRKVALPCMVCKAKGFYACKLCKGNSTIEWSPLYDPIVINPCLCPTCDGNRSGFSTLKTDLCTLRELRSFLVSASCRACSRSPVRFRVQRCLNCLGKGYA